MGEWQVGNVAWGLYSGEIVYGEIVDEIPATEHDSCYAEILDGGDEIPVLGHEVIVDERASGALAARRENDAQVRAGQMSLPFFPGRYRLRVVRVIENEVA